jgi:FlaA1/EpsC-like NDP-sugar epimerase
MDNNESELFFLDNQYRKTGLVISYLGDVRDSQKLLNITKGVELIIHTAALKHVSLSEYNPFDAVQTNITGVKNVVHAAMHNNVPRMIFISSDKAVNPTNVMGILDLYDLSKPKSSAIIFLSICLGLGIAITLYVA